MSAESPVSALQRRIASQCSALASTVASAARSSETSHAPPKIQSDVSLNICASLCAAGAENDALQHDPSLLRSCATIAPSSH